MLDDYIVTKEAVSELVMKRMSLGLTQTDVGNALGYQKSNLSMFENGRNKNLTLYLRYKDYLEGIENERKEKSNSENNP